MKVKVKPEATVQIRISVRKSVAVACDLARQQSKDTPYDWNGTMAEAVEKANSEFVEFLAKAQPKVQPGRSLNPVDRVSTRNGSDPDRA
jgi:hypothetical protein